MARALVAILGLVLVAGMAMSGYQLALHDAGRDHAVSNETWTPNAGTYVALERSNLANANYEADVTVENATGVRMDRGTDYEWNETDGTVLAIVGGDLDGDATATISYGYAITTDQQRELAGVLGIMPEVVGALAPLLGIVLVLRLLGGG